jgi:hypothetical protein
MIALSSELENQVEEFVHLNDFMAERHLFY